MKNAIFAGMQSKIGVRFIIGVMSVFVVVMLSSTNTLITLYRNPQLQPYGYHLTFLLTALRGDAFSPISAIVAVLPFSACYVDDVKSKFARFTMLRTGYTTYLLSRVIICFFLGGMVLLTGILFSYFTSALVFLPIEHAATAENIRQLPELGNLCLLIFFNGGLWAVFGLAMSTVMESKYIAYASPFVTYYLLVILCERYIPNVYLLYPREWLTPSPKWPLGSWGVAVFLIELTTLLGILFYCRAKRRLEQL